MPLPRRRRVRVRPANFNQYPYQDLAALWMLRILLDFDAWRELGTNFRGFTVDGDILRALGLSKLENQNIEPEDFLDQLKQREAELSAARPDFGGALETNLHRLGDALGLAPTERRVLGFAVVCLTHKGLAETTDLLGELTNDAVKKILGTLLDLPRNELRKTLALDGLLARSGVLRLERNRAVPLQHKLEPMDGLVDLLLEPHSDIMEMLGEYFHPAKAPGLDADDFDYLGRRYAVLRDYLAQARKRGAAGVNILLHGRPGTGKTELARILARQLDLQLYEIGMADAEGDAIHGERRFSAYQLSQQILARQSDALILFDEIEDVFPDPPFPFAFFGRTSRNDRRKAWTNRLLEENPVPALWISNDIRQIDTAYIRRFDLVLPLETPPRRIRERILKRNLQSLAVSDDWIRQMAEHPHIAPALVERAARVVSAVHAQDTASAPRQTQEQDLEDLIGNTLQAMGHPQRTLARPGPVNRYRRDILNTDHDLDALVQGLTRRPEARICLYGPPGTGKTAFGRHLAEQLDKPLLLRRASDLLGPYVGMTEHRIAEMFRQAANDDALLLLDEADSFLRERSTARQSWEVTQVNELLTQMEAFDGLFICSTNLMQALDQAALRRFDLKLRFNALRPPQAWTLFKQILADHGRNLRKRTPWQHRLAQLDNLTPGDFHAVLRARRLAPDPLTPEALLQGLEQECTIKADHQGRGIGFTAAIH